MVSDFPGLLSLLPDRGSPAFGLCLACWVVAVLVPLLTVMEVTRWLGRVRAVVAEPVVAEPVAVVREVEPLPLVEEPVAEVGVPVMPTSHVTHENGTSTSGRYTAGSSTNGGGTADKPKPCTGATAPEGR